jgi:hypothetical protein
MALRGLGCGRATKRVRVVLALLRSGAEMMDRQTTDDRMDHPVLQRLAPGETVEALARAASANLLVTDRRIAVAESDRVALDVPFEGLRRIQFDIERERPATLVIVPEHPSHEPQVMAVPPERYPEVTRALALIGERLYQLR